MTTAFQRHAESWTHCRRCGLCEKRKHVVLARGEVPADVLFVGEAPGASEDVLGQPFVGPAGKLLDRIIGDALDIGREVVRLVNKYAAPCYGSDLVIAFTNLVACIPLGEEGTKTAEPPQESIEACAPRLREFIEMCQPKLIVMVGKLAAKWTPSGWGPAAYCQITHPAAILRADISQRGLMRQRCVVTLADAMAEL